MGKKDKKNNKVTQIKLTINIYSNQKIKSDNKSNMSSSNKMHLS